jgi:zinc protease
VRGDERQALKDEATLKLRKYLPKAKTPHVRPVLRLVASMLCLGAGFSVRAESGQEIRSRVSEFTLRNGLQVIVYVDSSAPVVSTVVAYRVGSVDEPLGKTGLAHMAEHMLYKHTNIYRPGEFARIVRDAGGTYNGEAGEYLSAYYETFSRDRWELGLKLEAARMGRCVFPDSEFDSEHQVVLEEVRLRGGRPLSILFRQFWAVAYLVHPMRSRSGWMKDVEHLTAADVREWYARYYNPANAVLVVAGDVRVEDVRQKVEKHFGALKGRPVARQDVYDLEPEQMGERRILVHHATSVPHLLIGYHVPGARDSTRAAGHVLMGLLGQGSHSRLQRALVEDSGLAASVSAYMNTIVERDPGLMMIHVVPKAESLVPRIERIMEHEIDSLRRVPPDERELAGVKKLYAAFNVFALDDLVGMAEGFGAFQITEGNWQAGLTFPDAMSRVTPEQVSDFCRTWLRPDNRTVGLLVTGKEEEK